MNQKYTDWIKTWLSTNNPRGMCYSASSSMMKEFPELKLIRGYVTCDQGVPAHWWCVDVDGNIVDPTAAQFTNIVLYEEYQEGMEVQIGKCMNCGWEIYDTTMNSKKSTSVCSNECSEALDAEYNTWVSKLIGQ